MRRNSWKFRRIDRYIIRQFLGTYVFSILLIIAITVVFDVNERLDNFLKPEVSLHAIVTDYYLNFIPYCIGIFSPLFTFVSVIFFTSKLADRSEIIALLSGGVSFNRLLRPYLISAAIIALGSYLLNAYIIPPANETRIKFQNAYFRNKKVEYARNIQLEVEPGVFAYFDNYRADSYMGYRFSLDHFENKVLVSRLTAESIKYDSLYQWTIIDYMIRDFDGMYERVTTGTRKDTTLTFTPSDFLISENDCETMTSPQLAEHIRRQKKRGIGNIQFFEIEYYQRYATIMSFFILTMIGVSLSSRKIKGGMGLNIGIGIGLSFSYILFSKISSTFAISGFVPPMIAVWIPNLIYACITVYLYSKAPR
ncbi:MAG: LptF/LptG family permease [Tannerella sp.]|jgi:lipopolysaccharide export system permease protein|nr:LptF/LptG family permease [Tannerella sp.]